MRNVRRFFRNWQIWMGLVIVGAFLFVAIAAPILAPPEEGEENPGMFKTAGRPSNRTPQPPSEGALLGTLPGQLDVHYTLVWGSRHALRFGLTVALVTALIGILVGALSGYAGGNLNGALMRVTDGFLTIPVIVGVGIFRQLAILAEPAMNAPAVQKLMAVLGTDYIMLGLIFFSWMPYARLINANMRKLLHVDYVNAARSIGVRPLGIIFRHLLPNAITPAIVLVARDIGAMVLMSAAFVFIGMGGDSPWGELATRSRYFIVGSFGDPFQMWWTYIPVTLALILFGVGWNLLGDGLNDVLNPHEHYW